MHLWLYTFTILKMRVSASKEEDWIRSREVKLKYLYAYAYSGKAGQIMILTRIQERIFQTNGNSSVRLEGLNVFTNVVYIMNLIKIICKEDSF